MGGGCQPQFTLISSSPAAQRFVLVCMSRGLPASTTGTCSDASGCPSLPAGAWAAGAAEPAAPPHHILAAAGAAWGAAAILIDHDSGLCCTQFWAPGTGHPIFCILFGQLEGTFSSLCFTPHHLLHLCNSVFQPFYPLAGPVCIPFMFQCHLPALIATIACVCAVGGTAAAMLTAPSALSQTGSMQPWCPLIGHSVSAESISSAQHAWDLAASCPRHSLGTDSCCWARFKACPSVHSLKAPGEPPPRQRDRGCLSGATRYGCLVSEPANIQ